MTEERQINVDYGLLAKYLNEEADGVETAQVNEWVNASVENRQEFEKLRQAWEIASAEIGMKEWNEKRSKEQFLLKVIHEQAEAIRQKEIVVKISRRLIQNIWKYAAVAVVLIGVSGILVYNLLDDHQGGTFTEVAVSKGSRSQMTLPDGSQVWLNADSKIKYTSDFNKLDRSIYLEGEAYFEVAKNLHKTFLVNGGGLVVEAVGTAFNVKAYPNENVVEATLVEGLVKVGPLDKPSQMIILKPNEQVFYYKPDLKNNQSEKLLVSKGIESSTFTSWMNGQIEISGETLDYIAIKLGRQYDVQFHFDDPSIRNLRFTGVFKNETIEQVLEVLKISSPVSYRIHEREIWLTRKPGTMMSKPAQNISTN